MLCKTCLASVLSFYALDDGSFIFFICVFQLSIIFHFHDVENEKFRQKLGSRFFRVDFPRMISSVVLFCITIFNLYFSNNLILYCIIARSFLGITEHVRQSSVRCRLYSLTTMPSLEIFQKHISSKRYPWHSEDGAGSQFLLRLYLFLIIYIPCISSFTHGSKRWNIRSNIFTNIISRRYDIQSYSRRKQMFRRDENEKRKKKKKKERVDPR